MKGEIQKIINMLDELKNVINLEDEDSLLRKLEACKIEYQKWMNDDSVYKSKYLPEYNQKIEELELKLKRIELVKNIQNELKELA